MEIQTYPGKIRLSLIVMLAFFIFHDANSQCQVTAIVYPKIVCAGDAVTLSANGGCGFLMNNDFNNGTIGVGWYSSAANPVFNNPCGPGPNGAHLWVGTTPSNVRTLVTNDYDVSIGGCDIQWWMRYGLVQDSGSCEAPDQSNEGVHLQWSNDSGSTWTDFPGPNQKPVGNLSNMPPYNTDTLGSGGYWTPDSIDTVQQSNELYYWNLYKNTIPSAANSQKTRFRWAQLNYNGQGFDTWGIDQVEIKCPTGNLSVLWSHGPTVLNTPSLTLPSQGNTPYDTCFHVTVADTINSATDSVCVTVNPVPSSDFTISDTSICAGDTTKFTYAGSASSIGNYNWDFDGASATGQGPHTRQFPNKGQKTASLTVQENGCKSKTVKTLYVHPYPSAQIHQQWIETDERIFSDISGAGATNYQITSRQWNFGSAATPQSSVDSSVSVMYTSPGTHQAELVVTNNGGCPDTTQSDVVITGMVDNKYKNGIKLFPNPAQKYVNIHIPAFIEELPELRLYDIQGKLIRKEAIQNRTTKLYLHQLSPGNYMLVLENNSFVLNKKIRVK